MRCTNNLGGPLRMAVRDTRPEEGERLQRITSETLVGSFGPQPRTPPPALSSSVGLDSGWCHLDVSQGAPRLAPNCSGRSPTRIVPPSLEIPATMMTLGTAIRAKRRSNLVPISGPAGVG